MSWWQRAEIESPTLTMSRVIPFLWSPPGPVASSAQITGSPSSPVVLMYNQACGLNQWTSATMPSTRVYSVISYWIWEWWADAGMARRKMVAAATIGFLDNNSHPHAIFVRSCLLSYGTAFSVGQSGRRPWRGSTGSVPINSRVRNQNFPASRLGGAPKSRISIACD